MSGQSDKFNGVPPLDAYGIVVEVTECDEARDMIGIEYPGGRTFVPVSMAGARALRDWLNNAIPANSAPGEPVEATYPHDLLEEAAATLRQRGVDYDGKGYQGGERSMAQTVAIFRAWTGIELSELDGWRFMMCLKMARSTTGTPKLDTYVDLAGYVGLAGERALVPQDQLDKPVRSP